MPNHFWLGQRSFFGRVAATCRLLHSQSRTSNEYNRSSKARIIVGCLSNGFRSAAFRDARPVAAAPWLAGQTAAVLCFMKLVPVRKDRSEGEMKDADILSRLNRRGEVNTTSAFCRWTKTGTQTKAYGA